MAKRKTFKMYDVAGLRGVVKLLEDHRASLVEQLRTALTNDLPDFDAALEIRNTAQRLVATCMAVENMPVTIKLAQASGEPQAVAYLAECGLEDE